MMLWLPPIMSAGEAVMVGEAIIGSLVMGIVLGDAIIGLIIVVGVMVGDAAAAMGIAGSPWAKAAGAAKASRIATNPSTAANLRLLSILFHRSGEPSGFAYRFLT